MKEFTYWMCLAIFLITLPSAIYLTLLTFKYGDKSEKWMLTPCYIIFPVAFGIFVVSDILGVM